jgi:hypothetical protein
MRETNIVRRAIAAAKMGDEENYGFALLNALDEWNGNLWSKVVANEWRKSEINAKESELFTGKSTRNITPVDYATDEALVWMVL